MLPPLYEKSGALRLSLFEEGAREVLVAMTRWLEEIGRGIYLPLDLMVVLLERDHVELSEVIASGTVGTVLPDEVLARLRELGREIEDHHSGTPTLERDAFSRSYARILDEAWEQANGRGAQITEGDLLRAVMWRAEVTESASVRWAIKRLSEGGGDRLFDGRAQLKREAFDDVAWGFLQAGMQLAARSGTPFLGTPHLVAALCSVKESVLWRAATARGLEPTRLREELLRIIGVKPGPLPDFLLGRKTLTPRMVRMLGHARAQAAQRDGEEAAISEAALVEAFLQDGGSSLELVQALGLEAEVTKALGEPRVLHGAADLEQAVSVSAVWEASAPTPTLDLIGRDLTRQAREGKLPRILGRDRELQRVINVLLRKEQRNPLLKGEAGVGKTALAMALAQRIAEGRVPKPLLGQRVVEINGASLMSGTSYRGELESRIKSLLQEACKGVILFIDEAHAVFAPRTSSHGPAEIPNHFKSALASGELAVVAATTEAEYRRWMELDPALKRRFEGIEIGEPKAELTLTILRELARELERDYEVQVSEEAIQSAMDYSVRYLPEQRLPDKAQKLLMDAAIAAAHPLGDEEEDAPARAGGPVRVERGHVARQVSHRTGIPVERLVLKGDGWWRGIGERLRGHLTAQEGALESVSRALVAGRLRPAATSRPLAVLVFFGPSGSGKGTLARALGAEVYGDPRAFMRLDMTDFSEPHTISRLIGSPPGYVGYEDEDMFVTPLRRRPSAVVLLEDIDKAHSRVLERLLRVFEEGEIADTRGLVADARQAIFVLNVTSESRGRSGGRIGFGEGEGGGQSDAERAFEAEHPELYARLRGRADAFVRFERMSAEAARELGVTLLERQLEALAGRLQEEYSVSLGWSAEALEALGAAARRSGGAEGLAERFQAEVVRPITELLLRGEARQGGGVSLEVSGEGVVVRAVDRVVSG